MQFHPAAVDDTLIPDDGRPHLFFSVVSSFPLAQQMSLRIVQVQHRLFPPGGFRRHPTRRSGLHRRSGTYKSTPGGTDLFVLLVARIQTRMFESEDGKSKSEISLT